MKYLIPFWWHSKNDETKIKDSNGILLILSIVIGLFLTTISLLMIFIEWNITNKTLRFILLASLLWIVPNYYISYRFWKNK